MGWASTGSTERGSVTHLGVLLEGVKADASGEIPQGLARPPPLLVHVQHRLQRLLYVLQPRRKRYQLRSMLLISMSDG